MPDTRSPFVWYELMTTDTAAAKAFYTSVVGWGTQDAQMPGMEYTMWLAGGAQVGGLAPLHEDARKMGAPPHWMGYVGVEDVDATVERAKRLGASVYVPPQDIPNVGRFAVLADPQKATFAVFQPAPMDQQGPPPGGMGSPGHVGWHELGAEDWEKAFGFYSELFGWGKGDAMDMGGMGTYQLFNAGAENVGGVFNKPPMVPVACWLYYFNVGDIDAAAERVKTGGGQVVNGPMEVPGGGWILQGMDPQGGMFALLGRRG